ncbi:MAG: TIM barrel protein [Dehalococcoidia bacterium]|nr:TIM barrel protein [Dehalococcoidia bacterium]
MKVTKAALKKLGVEYRGYLDGEKLDRFFKEFRIKFAAGYWAAGGFADRFATGGYDPGLDESITARLERVAEAKIKGVEVHDTVFTDAKNRIDKNKIALVKAALARLGLEATNMNTNLFSDAKWKLGGITNANKSIRDDALAIALQSVDIAGEIGCKSVALWPGSDGWDYNFEVNYGQQLDRFVDGCIAINKKAKSLRLRFGIEAKLHEPREGNMVVPTTHLAILVARMVNEACGGDNMGVAVDYGHEQMYAVEPASMLYVARKAGVPVVNFHLNNAKLHSNDEDRIAGTGDIWRLTDFCYAAIDTGYNGWFGEDQFTYRTDPVKSMALSRELFGNIMKKALLIYAHKDLLEAAQATGDAIATIEVVKKHIIAE